MTWSVGPNFEEVLLMRSQTNDKRIGILLVLGALTVFPVFAQRGAAPASQASLDARIKEAASTATPRAADGHPDMSGFWVPANSAAGALLFLQKRALDTTGQKPVVPITLDQEIQGDIVRPAQRWADKAARPVYKPEYVAKAKENFEKSAKLDPAFQCQPPGVPRMGAPNEIVQNSRAVYLLYDQKTTFRVIPTDGRQHDRDADAMPAGDAVGRWDGDTLVVDVTNLSPDTWLDLDGSFHDKNMHVTERFTRKGNTLVYEVTVEDPTLFAQPFNARPVTLLLGKAEEHVKEDYPCAEFDRVHLVTDERH